MRQMDNSQERSQGGVSGGLHETADTAREVAQTLERSANALDTAGRTAEAVGQRVDRYEQVVERAGARLATNARQHPMAAVAVAMAVGFVMGRAMD
jgi:ElaB/YqjD/DUF883 family membrane-anchored ribosome-binding protein